MLRSEAFVALHVRVAVRRMHKSMPSARASPYNRGGQVAQQVCTHTGRQS